jgi:hypothetical protein
MHGGSVDFWEILAGALALAPCNAELGQTAGAMRRRGACACTSSTKHLNTHKGAGQTNWGQIDIFHVVFRLPSPRKQEKIGFGFLSIFL